MMDLQFERFRETASLNLHSSSGDPRPPAAKRSRRVEQLNGDVPVGETPPSRSGQRNPALSPDTAEAMKISAAQRLGLFRDRAAAPALAERLRTRAARSAPPRRWPWRPAARGTACRRCWTRWPTTIPSWPKPRPWPWRTSPATPNRSSRSSRRPSARPQADAWRAWFQANPWDAIEQSLIEQMAAEDRAVQRPRDRRPGARRRRRGPRGPPRSSSRGRRTRIPIPPFENDNRTDSFTYPADSPLNPRTLQEAVRALGHLNDAAAVPLLARHPGQPHRPEDRQPVSGRSGDRGPRPDRHARGRERC